VASLDALTDRVHALMATQSRVILGITGAPGAGKSTLAQGIVTALGTEARLIGMDGYHLSNSVLAKLGIRERKGAIDTFDGAGFVELIRRLRSPSSAVIYAPEFRREIEESIVGAVAVGPEVRLVVIEGNYLLIPEAPWGAISDMTDEMWYCEVPEPVRLTRLVARHVFYGKSENEARAWALGPDQRNAKLVETTRALADLIVTPEAGPEHAVAQY
jgi:pantothenate kinase